MGPERQVCARPGVIACLQWNAHRGLVGGYLGLCAESRGGHRTPPLPHLPRSAPQGVPPVRRRLPQTKRQSRITCRSLSQAVARCPVSSPNRCTPRTSVRWLWLPGSGRCGCGACACRALSCSAARRPSFRLSTGSTGGGAAGVGRPWARAGGGVRGCGRGRLGGRGDPSRARGPGPAGPETPRPKEKGAEEEEREGGLGRD